jgi:uncharacterized membrane protein
MKRFNLRLALVALAAMTLSLTRPAAAQIEFKFQTLDVPFAGASQTQPLGINNQGVIVGIYVAADGIDSPGFVFDKGAWISVTVPGAGGDPNPPFPNLLAGFFGINEAGTAVGSYTDQNFGGHSFLRSAEGTITRLPDLSSVPGDWTVAWGINDAGTIVGYYGTDPLLNLGGHHGFILRHGVITVVDYPGAVDTELFSINNRHQIVGQWFDAVTSHGLMLDHGVLSSFDPPGSTFTYPQHINNAGDIVGAYDDAASKTHGFLRRKGVYYTFDYPGASNTTAEGINDHGQIVGVYNNTGFVATIHERH